MSIIQIGFNVYFNNNWLNSVNGLMVLSSNPYTPSVRTIFNAALARSNKTKTSSAFYTGKTIVINMAIAMPSRGQLEQSIDSLSAMLQGLEKDLVLMQGGNARKYTATLGSLKVGDAQGGYANLEADFVCSDVLGMDTASTSLISLSALTAASRTDSVTFGGTSDYQYPLITITLSAVTGGTGSITVGNNNTGQQITVTRTWTAGDVLVIDTYNKTVQVNNVSVAFSGAFPTFLVGSGTFYYADTFSTRTYNYTATYIKRYA